MATNDAKQLLKLPALAPPPKQQQARQQQFDLAAAQKSNNSTASLQNIVQESSKHVHSTIFNGTTTSTNSDKITQRACRSDFEQSVCNKENVENHTNQSTTTSTNKRKLVKDENDSQHEQRQSKLQQFRASQLEQELPLRNNQIQTKHGLPGEREYSGATILKQVVVESSVLLNNNFDNRQQRRTIPQLATQKARLPDDVDGEYKIQSRNAQRECNGIIANEASNCNDEIKNSLKNDNDRKDKSLETDDSSNMSVSMEELEDDDEKVPTIPKVHDRALEVPIATAAAFYGDQKIDCLSLLSAQYGHPSWEEHSKTNQVADSSENSLPTSIQSSLVAPQKLNFITNSNDCNENINAKFPLLPMKCSTESFRKHGRNIASYGKPPLLASHPSNQKHSMKASKLLPGRSMMKNVTVVPNLGLPQRADPNQSIDDLEDDDSTGDNFCASFENPNSSNRSHQPNIGNTVNTEAKASQLAVVCNKQMKITKTDLTYMWQWDPDRRFNTTGNRGTQKKQHKVGSKAIGAISAIPIAETGMITSETTTKSLDPVILETIEPTDSSEGNSSSKNHSCMTKKPTCDSSFATASENKYNSHKNDLIFQKTSQYFESSDSNVKSSQTPISKVNKSFVRLVSESNMMWVNGISYAKLGVIGKGGSCKVYRALSSKDYSTVAIKKVKIDGMGRKAIEGYSNEIQLLKRLRGNPSIIQLHDSEVDTVRRKSIFLVMEVGEVDLNHVLQKQELEMQQKDQSEKLGVSRPHGGRLNLNFIRLTWQQMLTAVHSMHEERIIHGDLKPANFLFVRGTLKLIDFGIAKAIQSDDTTNIYRESHIGTLNYMSPESLLADCSTGNSNDAKRMKCGRPSDIWSLGCILYQMIYGKTPFYDLHTFEKMKAIANPNHKIPYPTTVGTSGRVFDPLAVDAIQQCLRWKASERAPIVGTNGLLNEHQFLNSSSL